MTLSPERAEKFSQSICKKFPMQTVRHWKSANNARWMLRNKPISPLSKNQRAELIAIAKLDK